MSENVQRLLIIIRHSPTGSSWVREALETALVGAALGQSISLLFMGEGVLALLPAQQSGPLGQKGTGAMIDVLPMYDIEQLHVTDASLEHLGLRRSQLACDTGPAEPAELIAQSDLVLNF
ncbi:tRNA 2-thiouridine synthesizing protein C [Kushneria sinocarnis]|uniref:tRNA 2-thiouridine synthesizing protein C n=1 Tax=Kushneria sinocarnis TaxID=595502 RepID=A0A420WYG9_9GAMM|nr:sulfurtransferase complex subunit TusC [Kushneria sinocarnis]RKR06226.1 tRNA 2-thiouridine synthesizing protein C [Kushneria sinocarnis]